MEKCDVCKIEKEDVSVRRDPYQYDVNDTEVFRPLCDDCEGQLRDDI